MPVLSRAGLQLLPLLLLAAVSAPSLHAGSPRDVVFECPCRAEWNPGGGGAGEFTVHFGIRSFKTTESRGLRLQVRTWYPSRRGMIYTPATPVVATVAALSNTAGLRWTAASFPGLPPPPPEAVLQVYLESDRHHADETLNPDNTIDRLSLWRVPGNDDSGPGRVRRHPHRCRWRRGRRRQ